MKKNIAEDLPSRNYPAASSQKERGSFSRGDDRDQKSGGEAKTPEKQARQAVYDIRYRSRREGISLMQAYSQYMQSSNLSAQVKTLVKQLLSGKTVKESIEAKDFDIENFASTNVANTLYRVFVENTKEEDIDENELKDELKEAHFNNYNKGGEKKYKVRVSDKNGTSYVRYATRDKISELRANPNIESVEMTGYGEPYEGEKQRGERTAAATAGKDWDGDGKIESGAKEYRGVVHNAIQRKRGGVPDGKDTSGVKEAFLFDGADGNLNQDENQTPIDVMKGKNVVKINPEVPGSNKNARSFQYAHYEAQGNLIYENGYRKFLKTIHSLQEKAESEQQQKLFGLALSVKRGQTPRSEVSSEVLKIVDSMSEAEIRKFAKTKHKGLPVHKEEYEDDKKNMKTSECSDDSRSLPTTVSLIKARLRSRGIKDPNLMMMSAGYEPEGDLVSEEEHDRVKDRRGFSGGNDPEPPNRQPAGPPMTEAQRKKQAEKHRKTTLAAIKYVRDRMEREHPGSTR